jgi:mono/diheme cytochrome c family protein
VAAFPDVEDEIEVVADGRGSMPSFGDRLSTAEIDRVVTHTRTL